MGVTEPSVGIDHIDWNGLNNQSSNLRLCSTSQNGANKRKNEGKYSSQFKGVTWFKLANKWKADIQCNKKVFTLVLFISEEEAARAYDKRAQELFGEFAHLNFP